MRSKGVHVPAAVDRWEKASRDAGCLVTGGPAECHHIIGARQKRKINLLSERVGAWFLIPVSREVHLMLDTAAGRNELSLDLYDQVFDERYGMESRMFNRHSANIFGGNYLPWHIHSYLLNFVENQKR